MSRNLETLQNIQQVPEIVSGTVEVQFNNYETELSSTNLQDAIQELDTVKATIESPTFTGTVSGITSTMVGLGNVDNTSDENKPISTATQTALDLKANQSTTYTKTETDSKIVELAPTPDLSPYYTKTETDNAIAALVDSAPTALNTLNELASALGDDVNFSTTVATNIGTVSSNLSSHSSDTSNPHSVTKTQVGLGLVDNTSDVNKPVSTAQQTALNLKANIASPTFTGTVSGITSAMVGLGNVTNESKATMFTSPTFTGTVTAPTFSGALSGNAATATTSTNVDGGTARISSIRGIDQQIENNAGYYLHIGGWGVGRTDASAVLVNSSYMADVLSTARTINGVSFDGSANITISGATGAGSDKIFFENGQTITTSYSITSGMNAMTAGPITINNGVTITIPDGSSWTIV